MAVAFACAGAEGRARAGVNSTEKTGFGGIESARERGRMAMGEGERRRGTLAGNARIAARLRKKLLVRLEKVADAIPDGAVTEVKGAAREDGSTTLFKLRDLTAAYKDLAEAPEEAGGVGGDVEDLSALAEMLKGE